MIEENVYLKAMSVINDALEGQIVNPVAVSTATNMFVMLWSSIYQERLRKEQIKDALLEVWEEKITEKDKSNGKS